MKQYYPHIYFFITAFVIILIGEASIFHLGNSALDINVHDTYFVIAQREMAIVLCVLYLLAGFMYWIFQKLSIKLYSTLTATHTIITLGGIYFYHAGLLYFTYFSDPDPFTSLLSNNENIFNLTMYFSLLIVQLLFIVNIIISIFRHLKTKSK
ncbi:hypothetical protein [Psychroserpens luteolus]|uniref:hypothetical protein n=1 Tax=Psychroserpens luteolus TaxID=2855840 RepID=UPI001E37949F|nr:hypothetical protein [Psychroserpens luteolus]MCD2258876.1 hypothetical protein [Psychroserpens luteolus]